MGIATLADIEAIESVPLAERDLPTSTYEALQFGAAVNPHKIALQFFLRGTHYKEVVFYTYEDLMALITQTANMFYHLGIGQDDVVSMILPNVPQAFFTIFGGETAGIVNPINPLLEPEVMAGIMRAAGTKVLVTLAPFPTTDIWQKVASIADDVPTLETILRVDLTNFLTGWQKWGAKWLARGAKGNRVRAQVFDFGQKARYYPPDRLVSGRIIQPDNIASYFHTGGTTGVPKIAQHTHMNEVFDAWSASRNIDTGDAQTNADKVMYCGLPLFHVNGYLVSGLIPFSVGAMVVLGTPAGFRGQGVLDHFWQIVQHYGVNYFNAVPTVFSALLDVPVADSDVSSLEYALCGAAPMPVEVFRAFEERTGIRILEGYGLTEGACVCSANPGLGERRVGSIGYRLPYQEMKTVMLDDAGNYVRDCRPDEVGTVVVRGPNVFKGYLEDEHNEGVWLDTGDENGRWLNTGDLGRLVADGYFWLTGRKKELIIRGGHNIDPQMIEAPLYQHPAVELAAAVGRPDPRAGELPVAYVQLKQGVTATPEALLAFAAERIKERAAVPKAVRIVETLPLTAVGKIYKPHLVRQEVQDVFQAEIDDLDGIAQASVEVKPDRVNGMVACVHVQPANGGNTADLQAHIQQTLGRYPIHYELSIQVK